jgi:NAD(P)-dependent dehydrogenase (short-subunit alcohol dehydrogenase family)
MPTALVTGSNRGIGIELVRQLAEQGWTVIATCRNPHSAEKLRELAAESQGRIEILPLDAADHGSIRSIVATLNGRPIDLLMCNAGIAGPKPPLTTGKEGERIQDYHDDTWFEVLRTNLLGPVRIAGYLAGNVAASERKLMGFVTSRMANIEENSNGAFYMYRASKAALNTAIKNLSLELGKSGVICVGLHPGWVRTDFAPTGPVEPSASASGLLQVMLGASRADNGHFITYTGERVAW